MSFVIADPQVMASVGVQLAGLGATLEDANAAAAPALAVVPAAADEVSAAIADAFTGFGHEYQAMASQAAAFHQAFSKNLTANAAAYAATDSSLGYALSDAMSNLTNLFSSSINNLVESVSFLEYPLSDAISNLTTVFWSVINNLILPLLSLFEIPLLLLTVPFWNRGLGAPY
jgi:hypothetical protein